MKQTEITLLEQEMRDLGAEAGLALLGARYGAAVVFSTSFSFEDQVITHFIARQQLPVELFTLDTGRLFTETYSVWSRTIEMYGITVKAYYPDAASLETFVREQGPNAFYTSVGNRKTCCNIRKVEPLKRALLGKKIWVTGLRREHSPDRSSLPSIEWDAANQIVKYHPLLNWSTAEVKNYVHQNGIPYNPLHDKGFVSIGCAPCTRAIRDGEDFRAGRWWWEDADKKECGLHAK